jgi:DNA-binding SARP family transcriptional activator
VIAQILGPLLVETDGHPVAPSAQQIRQVLALLVVRANEPVSVDTVMRELWGPSRLPASALTTVQTYILNLRKLFAAAAGLTPREIAKSILLTERQGYRLCLPMDDIDAARFTVLTREGSRALAAGDAQRAADQLGSALSLWRGPALSDIQAGEVIAGHVNELEIHRLAATEQRIAADLLLGRHYEVLAELAALVAEHPFNEALHAQYLLALHHIGRRAEALQVYQQLRTSLSEQMGLEPIPALQEIHLSILSADESGRQQRTMSARLRAVGVPLPVAA